MELFAAGIAVGTLVGILAAVHVLGLRPFRCPHCSCELCRPPDQDPWGLA